MVATWLGMPADPPNRSLMSACEVLTWIAFRRAIPQEGLHCLTSVSHVRWGEPPGHAILIALSARSGEFADGPYCPIRLPPGPWFGFDGFPSQFPHFRKEGPALLRRIRALRRKETGRLVSYAEVADMLKDEIEDDKRVSAKIEAARVTLLDRAAGGDLVAFGIRAGDDGEPRPGSIHEAIPATHLMHPMIGITEWDMVRVDTSHPAGKWLNLRIPEYAKVQFRTAEVLALWPAGTTRSPSTAEAPSSTALPTPSHPSPIKLATDHSGAPGRPTSKHLVLAEYLRRAEAGESCSSITEEGKALSAWLSATHSLLTPMMPRTVENTIRAGFNRRRARTK